MKVIATTKTYNTGAIALLPTIIVSVGQIVFMWIKWALILNFESGNYDDFEQPEDTDEQ